MNKDKKTVIFDLDGTLADITSRRTLSTKPNGKIDWGIFFNPINIDLDEPNTPVIKMAQMLKAQGFFILILSGRSKATKDATNKWLDKHDVPCDVLKMRPTGTDWHFMKDSLLKSIWLKELFDNPTEEIFAVFDDRNQVVDMWRDNGLTVFQVAEGDF